MADFLPDIDNCLSALNAGGIILYPTDTIWGIGADATNEQAVEKIFSLKRRPPRKSMIILVAEERDVLQYVASPDLRVFDYLQTRGKPTTVIYDGAIGLPDNLVAEDGSIAIRITNDPFCRHLIKRLRKPLVSTSANFAGEPSPASFRDIDEGIRSGVDHVVQYRQEEESVIQASSIVRWNKDGTVTVIRH